MKKFIYLLLTVFVLTSCSEYQKALKSTSLADKFKMATALYDQGKFNKANRLFVQIVPRYRGKPEAEKLMFMYANSFYEMRDYYTSNYQFERFVSAYASSEKINEAAFLGAKSYYHLSPRYSKEQQETIAAIDKLQAYINAYPDSEFIPEANELVKELDFKLEEKAFNIAKHYNTIGPYTRDYEACIKAFENFLLDYPGTSFREEALYYRFHSAYSLAINSVERRKEERLNTAVSYYTQFVKFYSNSEFIANVNEMNVELVDLLKNYNAKI